MKKLLIAGIALTALAAAPAMAADLAVKAPRAPYVAPAYSWTGCYLGVHVGGGIHHSDFTYDPEQGGNIGVVGGGQAGCNYQIRQLVVGIEGELYWANLKAKNESIFPSPSCCESHAFAKNTRDASLALRFGYAFDRLFLYGKLGADWGRLEWSQITIVPVPFCLPTACTFGSFAERTTVGLLFGAGFEYAVLDYLTAKLEYNYINFGNPLVGFTQTCSAPGVTPADCPGFFETRRDTKHILKVGLNYKFGWGLGKAPVIASY